MTNFLDNNKKILITYVYFEDNTSLSNINFFIKNGVFCNDIVQYNFIIKGDTCSAIFPSYDNIKVYKMKNEGLDFAGYSYSIDLINKDNYDYFIFLNSTVIGPFVPRYNSKCTWFIQFISLISDKVKLVGSTINRQMYNNIPKHVQSMAFATDKIGLQLLIDNNIFNINKNIEVCKNQGKGCYIDKFEIGMSGVIMNNEYEIDSFMQVDNNLHELSHGDVHFENLYFGITLNPIEIMFIKSNRINDKILKNYKNWNEV